MPNVKEADLADLRALLIRKEEEAGALRGQLVQAQIDLALRTKERDILFGFLDRTMTRMQLGSATMPDVALDADEKARFDEELQLVKDNTDKWTNAYAGLKVTAIAGIKAYLGGLGLPVV
jgi:hypothetical protein